MRNLIVGSILILGLGCKHWHPGESCASGTCPPEKTVEVPSPKVEVKPPPDVCVKAPAPKVIVETPPPVQMMAQPAAIPAQVASVPSMPVMQQVQMIPSGGNVASVPAMATTTQRVRPPRTRLAMGFGSIRIPFPVLRFYPVTVPGEVITETEMVQSAAVSTANYVPIMQQPVTTAAYVQPTIASYQPTVATYQPTVTAYQPQVTAVQQPVMVQTIPQPVTSSVATTPQNQVCPPVSRETIEQLKREVQRAEEQLNQMEWKGKK